MANAFSPTFGYKPQYTVRRDKEIQEFMDGLAGEAGHPNRTTFYIGQRGMGKTVILLELAELAEKMGYAAVRVVAGSNMLDEMIEGLQIAGQRNMKGRKNPIKSISAGAFGFSAGLTFTEDIQKNYGFRTKLTLLCETFMKRNKGVLFLIDEIRASSPEIQEFATTYQHLVGDGINIAVAMAGLPNAISSVLNDDILTFLNRANKVELALLPISDIIICFAKAFRDHAVEYDVKMLEKAALATDGYPYLFQLIGYNIFKFLDGNKILTDDIIDLAITSSKRALISDIFMPCLNPLSPEDKRFLNAMAVDSGESNVTDIRNRLNASSSHAQTYRKRLIGAGIIHSTSRGMLAFSIPYLRQHLRGEI